MFDPVITEQVGRPISNLSGRSQLVQSSDAPQLGLRSGSCQEVPSLTYATYTDADCESDFRYPREYLEEGDLQFAEDTPSTSISPPFTGRRVLFFAFLAQCEKSGLVNSPLTSLGSERL